MYKVALVILISMFSAVAYSHTPKVVVDNQRFQPVVLTDAQLYKLIGKTNERIYKLESNFVCYIK